MVTQTVTAPQPETCPECGGQIISEGESYCDSCGLVLDETNIDPGPEWREYSPEDREKRRTGPSVTPTRHEKGLTTEIGWDNTDRYGNVFSAQKRKRIGRLRKLARQLRVTSSERALVSGLKEIARMQSAVNLSTSIEKQACSLLQTAHKERLFPGMSVEGMASASLYAAIRINGLPVKLTEVAIVSRISLSEIEACYKKLNRELNLPAKPIDPTDCIPMIASGVDASSALERRAIDLVDSLDEQDYVGRDPFAVAATAVYISAESEDERPTQEELSEEADITNRTIQLQARELFSGERTSQDHGKSGP